MKREAAKAVRQSRITGTAGWSPTSEATHTAVAKWTNRVVLGYKQRGGGAAGGGREEGEMADAEEEEATGKARDVMMTEAKIATTTATEPEAEALATND